MRNSFTQPQQDSSITSFLKSDASNPMVVEVRYATFDHILYHSLMPWLPENRDRQLFEEIFSRLHAETGSFLSVLPAIFKLIGQPLSQVLRDEWCYFSKLRHQNEVFQYYQLFKNGGSNDLRTFFYHKLIGESMAAIITAFSVSFSMTGQMHVRKTLATRMIKKIREWNHAIKDAIEQHPESEPILIRLLIAIRIIELKMKNEYQACFAGYLSSGGYNELHHIHVKNNDINLQILIQLYQKQLFTDSDSVIPAKKEVSVSEEIELFHSKLEQAIYGHSAETPDKVDDKPGLKEEIIAKEVEPEKPVSAKVICDRFGLGKTSLSKLCKEYKIPHIKIGRLNKFLVSEAEAYFEANKRKQATSFR